VPSLFYAILMMMFGIVFGILAKFGFGRKLLETFPEIFSCGAVSKQGPSKEVAENTNFVSFKGFKFLYITVLCMPNNYGTPS
jgi:hypothetical protein